MAESIEDPICLSAEYLAVTRDNAKRLFHLKKRVSLSSALTPEPLAARPPTTRGLAVALDLTRQERHAQRVFASLTWPEVLKVVARFLEAASEAGLPVAEPIVLVGGSALAAHGVREDSLDVDIYTPNPPHDVVFRVEKELEAVYGEGFRLDVTGTENVWGNVLLRDIGSSPEVAIIESDGRRVRLQALRLEDVFLLKISAGRKKDRADIALLGRILSVTAVVSRFNQVLPWYGGTGVMGFADDVVSELIGCGANAAELIAQLGVPEYIRAALAEAHGSADAPS